MKKSTNLELNEDQKKYMSTEALLLLKHKQDHLTGNDLSSFEEFFNNNAYPLRFPIPKFTPKQVEWWKNQFRIVGIDVPDYLNDGRSPLEETIGFLVDNTATKDEPVTTVHQDSSINPAATSWKTS